jgi:hypothetical protein
MEAGASLTAALLARQNADGGYGARPGLPSATEPTALALFALSFAAEPAATQRLRAWLRGQQVAEQGWPAMPGVHEPGWVTALAVLALARYPDDPADARAARQGRDWLLARRGRTLDERRGLLARLLGRGRLVELDTSLVGWPWSADTFSWVEPTSYGVLALKAVRPGSEAATTRIEQGERLLLDRVCTDGGWNYGNSRVLGENLWGYPDTTALALLALGPGRDPAVTAKAADTLTAMLAENASGLATALGVLALALHGRDVGALRARLERRFTETGFVGDARALAWAVLASNTAARPFGGPAHA